MNRRSTVAIGLFFACTGCANYTPHPIDAVRKEAGFYERTLAAPFQASNQASQAAVPEVWDLASLLRVAVFYHPDLDVARARAASAEAGIITAGQRPNPTLSVLPKRSLNPGPGVSPWMLAFDLDIPIETAGKRGYRIAKAQAMSESARLELAETGWAVRSRLRATVVGYVFDRRELGALEAEVDSRRRVVQMMEQRLAAGEASRPELLALRVELHKAEQEVAAGAGRVAESRAALAGALGVSDGALEGLKLDESEFERLPVGEVTSPEVSRRIGLTNRLDVQRGLSDYGAADAALRLEIAKQYPDVKLGPGYEYDQGQNKYALGVSVELPILNQNRGPIAEAEAARKEAAARFGQIQALAIGRIERALALYRGALSELEVTRRIEAGTLERVATAERALRVGQQDRLELEIARLEGFAAARSRVAAQQRAQAALGEVEDALQRPLAGDGEKAATLPAGGLE